LKVALGRLLVATWWFSGREQSSANAHLSSLVQRHGTSYRAPSTTWTVSRQLWKHFCLHLISDCTLHLHCCMLRIFSIAPLKLRPYGAMQIYYYYYYYYCGLYGALESVVLLLHHRNCRHIINIIIVIIIIGRCGPLLNK